MAKRIVIPAPPTEHTIAWFEEALRAHPSPTGLLNTANSSLLTIAELSGELVGAWRRYCGQPDDLDIPALSAALGGLLVAVGRTAASLDLSLETLLVQQVAHLEAGATPKATKDKAGRPRKPPQIAVPEALPIVPPAPTRRRPRPLAAAPPEDPTPRAAPPGRTKHRQAPAAPPDAPGKPERRPSPPGPTQVPLFAEPPARPRRQRTSKASG